MIFPRKGNYYGMPIPWQSLIGRGPWHAIPIFLLENHMVGLIRFVTVHDSAMQSRLPFSSVLPHFCTRKLLRIKKSAILLLGIQSTTPSSNFWLTIPALLHLMYSWVPLVLRVDPKIYNWTNSILGMDLLSLSNQGYRKMYDHIDCGHKKHFYVQQYHWVAPHSSSNLWIDKKIFQMCKHQKCTFV